KSPYDHIERNEKTWLGNSQRLGNGLPSPTHYLSEMNKQQRLTCCVSLRPRELNFGHLFKAES
ncbi:unnamed protein product, partial [Hymenolepis diminuta]